MKLSAELRPDLRAEIVSALARALAAAWRRGKYNDGPAAGEGDTGRMRDEARKSESIRKRENADC